MYTYIKFKNQKQASKRSDNKFSPMLTQFFYQLAGPGALPLPLTKKPWCISKRHTSISNDKIFDMPKLNAFADDKN